MSILEALILGLLQGVTEFLPISSSGHLVLGESWLGLSFEDLKSFDVTVHLGTLVAILVYFWQEWWKILQSWVKWRAADSAVYRKLTGYIVLGTVPAILAGVFLEDLIDGFFREPGRVALMMVLVGVVFFLAERWPREKKLEQVGLRQALVIGLVQAVALIPGVSRSGSTIVGGLFQGVKRAEAARFGFLLGAPAILGAGVWTSFKVWREGGFEIPVLTLVVGFLAAVVAGLLAVSFLMRFLRTHSMKWFGIYLVVIGGVTFLVMRG